MKRVLTVLPAEAGQALVEIVGRRFSLRRAVAAQKVRAGAIYVDGRRVRDENRALTTGQRVVAHLEEMATPDECATAYLDRDVVVVDKPAGLPSIAPRRGGQNVASRLVERFGQHTRLIHRLDRETSGLLLAARTKRASLELARQLEEREITRRYFALVADVPTADRFEVDKGIASGRGRSRIDPVRGKPARTRFSVVLRASSCALVEAELDTGRMHQIRVHLASLRLPVVGDSLYGGQHFGRLALHAHALEFEHPRSGARLQLHCPLPATLRELLLRE